MASASVLIPLSTIEQTGGVLPPSALVQHAPRHGRSRAASTKGKAARGGRYSVVENRDVSITNAVTFVLKRSVRESDVGADQDTDEEHDELVTDDEGWASVGDLLKHERLADLAVTLADLERIEKSATKARYTLRRAPGADAGYQIREIRKRVSIQAPVVQGKPLTTDAEDLPEFVVYETTYEAYPRIIAAGAIQKAPGATYISFSGVTVAPDGSESHQARRSDADVGIWINLRSAMETQPDVDWHRTASGSFATTTEIPKSLWQKVVARRPEIGILFEDGEIRNEIPESLRGKGAKGKAKTGKGTLMGRAEEDSDSVSEE